MSSRYLAKITVRSHLQAVGVLGSLKSPDLSSEPKNVREMLSMICTCHQIRLISSMMCSLRTCRSQSKFSGRNRNRRSGSSGRSGQKILFLRYCVLTFDCCARRHPCVPCLGIRLINAIAMACLLVVSKLCVSPSSVSSMSILVDEKV